VKEYITAIAAVIAGVFAIASAILAWRLKNSGDDRARLAASGKERRDQIERLYTDIFVLFEGAIEEVRNSVPFTLAPRFSEANARVHLRASDAIVTQYVKTASLLEGWSRLYAKATPPRIIAGEQTFTMFQAPDPTKKYREPAQRAYETLQEELSRFVDLMRSEVKRGSVGEGETPRVAQRRKE
jgi:hypothetical protein